jgi:hypothetical protein
MIDSDVRDPGVFAAAQEVGGFNLLAPFVLRQSTLARFYLENPANLSRSEIFKVSIEYILQESIPGDSIYVAASIDNLESQTLPLFQHSHDNGIEFSISLDNWVYFPERLAGLGPSNLIVYDTFAFNYAKKVFGDYHNVSLKQNYYLDQIRSRVEGFHPDENAWLFLDARPNAFTQFDADLHENGCCCSQIADLTKNGNTVTFRPHPGYFRKSCLDFLTKMNPNIFRISQEEQLSEDLCTHSYVLGSPGYALYVAEMVGKKTFTTASTNALWNGPLFERHFGPS